MLAYDLCVFLIGCILFLTKEIPSQASVAPPRRLTLGYLHDLQSISDKIRIAFFERKSGGDDGRRSESSGENH